MKDVKWMQIYVLLTRLRESPMLKICVYFLMIVYEDKCHRLSLEGPVFLFRGVKTKVPNFIR